MKKKDIIKDTIKKSKETIDSKVLVDEVVFESGMINILRKLSAERSNIITMLEEVSFYKSKGYQIKYYYNLKHKELSYKVAKKRGIGFIYEDESKKPDFKI